jgi:hypothetical protein
MEKHRFNIFPEMSEEEYEKLKADLVANGYDSSQPIYIFEGAILDGWNRYRACDELGIGYAKEIFTGTPIEAINFVMRTNTRRNLNSGQRAALATEAVEIIEFLAEVIETSRRQKQAESLKESLSQKIVTNSDEGYEAKNCLIESEDEFPDLVYEYDEPKRNPNQNSVSQKVAKTFNTNRTYFQDAKKIKEVSPETFAKVKSGELSIPQAKEVIQAKSLTEWQEANQKKKEVKNEVGHIWRAGTAEIYNFCKKVNQFGIQNVAATFDEKRLNYWRDELRDLQTIFGKYADELQEIIDG